jgi:flagella basal body P-ring formation protein FlgA
MGEALENGMPGDVIRVRNTSSGALVHGRVGADGTVRALTPQ